MDNFHEYTQQKRLNYERAMNKYSRNLQENNTTTKFITNIIYYITKKLQINFIFEKSAHHKESYYEKIMRYFEKLSKLDVSMVSAFLLAFHAQGTLVM